MMRHRIFNLAHAAAIVTILGCAGGHCLGQDAGVAQIKALAQPYVDAEIVDGLSIGVIQDGKQTEVHLGHVRGDGEQPDSDTIYEIGSMSKVFTGILLADAVNRKELSLDQPAAELMPDGSTMPTWNDRSITVTDLATHRSGLPRLPDNMPSMTSDNPYADYTSKLANEFLSQHKLQREPGSKYEYSNLGMSYLGYLICEQAGESYDELLTKRIAEPLGMKDTRVALSESMKDRLATPHAAYGKETANWNFADMPGAGGIRSSTKDLLRLAKACLDPPDNEVGRVLELAWKKHHLGGVGEMSMGLGWHFAGDGETRWHNGQTGGYHSMLMVNREEGLAVVVLANTAYFELDQLPQDLMRMLSGQDVKPRQFEKSVEVAPEIMQRYVGQYALAPTFVLTVSVDENKLMVGATGQPTFQVYPRSDTEWFYKVVPATLTFKVDDDGKCSAVELFQGGVRQTAKRTK